MIQYNIISQLNITAKLNTDQYLGTAFLQTAIH